jgi:hypothetical protein
MVNAHYVIIDFRAKFFIKIQKASKWHKSLASVFLKRSLASDLGKSNFYTVLGAFITLSVVVVVGSGGGVTIF